MNILGRLVNYLAPRPVPKPLQSNTPRPRHATRDSNRVEKPKKTDARLQKTRNNNLSRAALRELDNSESSLQHRKRQRTGKVDDTPRSAREDEQVRSRILIGEMTDDQMETSQTNDHEIDSTPSNSLGPSAGRSEEDLASANEFHDNETSQGYGPAKPQIADDRRILDGLIDHRWEDGEIEVNVEWRGGTTTWEPERNVHLDAPGILFKYWNAHGGRPTNPEDPESFDIVAIRDHSKRRFLVEWTGYPPSENTWVPRKELKETAPDVVEEYLKGLKLK